MGVVTNQCTGYRYLHQRPDNSLALKFRVQYTGIITRDLWAWGQSQISGQGTGIVTLHLWAVGRLVTYKAQVSSQETCGQLDGWSGVQDKVQCWLYCPQPVRIGFDCQTCITTLSYHLSTTTFFLSAGQLGHVLCVLCSVLSATIQTHAAELATAHMSATQLRPQLLPALYLRPPHYAKKSSWPPPSGHCAAESTATSVSQSRLSATYLRCTQGRLPVQCSHPGHHLVDAVQLSHATGSHSEFRFSGGLHGKSIE